MGGLFLPLPTVAEEKRGFERREPWSSFWVARPLGFRSPGTRRTLDPHAPPSDLRLLPSRSSRRRPTLMLLHVACSSASVPDWLGFGFLVAEAETPPPPPPPQGLAPEGPSSRGSPHPPPLWGKRLPSLLLETTPLLDLVRFP
ncbi:hypothetical protein PVAP13_1NG225176 [Panicum virgatum]|uniref:Uncharacterized protein n=1 Tax=Panicum virgatum TaxID=38727 RepID=A0A8T0WVD3_PANVG|nr:hypothetical protein PVAP13_1NG225176 [Panicum virgatum]